MQTITEPKLVDLLKGKIITFFVGPTAVHFPVHEDLICQYSPYFRKLLRGQFKEGLAEASTVDVTDVPHAVSASFFGWLYSTSLKFSAESATVQIAYSEFLSLFYFADKYDVPLLRVSLLEAMHQTYVALPKQLPTLEDVANTYERLPETSPMLELIVDMYADGYAGKSKNQEEPSNIEKLPVKFLLAVTRRLAYYRDDRGSYGGHYRAFRPIDHYLKEENLQANTQSH